MRRICRKRSYIASLLGFLSVSLCQADTPSLAARLNLLSGDFDHPVYIASLPARPGELVIVEQKGLAKVFTGKDRATRTILDLEDLIGSRKTLGLLSLSFAPGEAPTNSGASADAGFIANYVDPQGDLVVARFGKSKDGVANDDTISVVIKIAQIAPNSHGSQVQYLQDGSLLITTGDGEEKNPPVSHAAQSNTSLLGKVLRIIPRPAGGYLPFHNRDGARPSSVLPEIWASGFRNPTHISVDDQSKRVFVIDNSDSVLEINIVEQGRNYGWDHAEGERCITGTCAQENLISPIISIPRKTTNDALIGGVVYNGSLFPQLGGRFIFAEASSGKIYAAKQSSGSHWDYAPLSTLLNERITAIGKDSAGELYVTTDKGSLFEIRP